MSDIFASVWTPDMASQLAPIPNRKGVQWQDVLNGAGMGQLSVPYDDHAAQYLTARNIVRFYYEGGYRYGFRIQQPKNVVVGQGAEADRWLSVSGPGLLDVLNDAVLYPEYGLTRQSGDQRSFSFASAQGDWYNASEWVAPLGVLWTSDTTDRAKNPKDWPDKGAYWIWDTNPDTSTTAGKVVYFRSSFTLSADTVLTIYATADNYFDLYLDGQLILSSDYSDRLVWQKTFSYPAYLASGTHLLAARVMNEIPPRSISNPAGFLCTVATTNAQGQPQTIIRHTDTTNWLCRPEGTDAPYWNAAEVLSTFITEAQTRSVTAVTHVTKDFTSTTDSAGVAWTDKLDRTFTIGTKGLDLVEQISELSVDVAMSPSLVCHAWKARGTDKSTGAAPVVLRPARNLSQYEVDTDLKITTRLLVRTPTGWVEVAASNEGTDGRVEDLLSLGNASSDAQATRQAQAAFGDIALPVKTFTAACVPVTGATPYVDFDLGDTILAPDGSGGTVALRLVSMTVTEDDKGAVTFTPELYA